MNSTRNTKTVRPKRSSTAAVAGLSTKEQLLEIGESIIGTHGFDGVSLREIAAAAGHASPSSIQYHFGDKNGLITAILEARLRQIDTLRRRHVANLVFGSPGYARDLLRALWSPMLTITDRDGGHVFCRFYLHFMLQPTIVSHPVRRHFNARGAINIKPEEEVAGLAKLNQLLGEHFDLLPRSIFRQRALLLSTMFVAAVIHHDKQHATLQRRKAIPFDIESILDMALVAFSAAA